MSEEASKKCYGALCGKKSGTYTTGTNSTKFVPGLGKNGRITNPGDFVTTVEGFCRADLSLLLSLRTHR